MPLQNTTEKGKLIEKVQAAISKVEQKKGLALAQTLDDKLTEAINSTLALQDLHDEIIELLKS